MLMRDEPHRAVPTFIATGVGTQLDSQLEAAQSDSEHPKIGRVDYARVMEKSASYVGEQLIAWLSEELAHTFQDAYLEMTPKMMDLACIQQGPFEYTFDDYTMLEAKGLVPYHPTMESRLVAAIGRSAPRKPKRDDFRLRNWSGPSLDKGGYGPGWDRGHFIAYCMGGVVERFELNVFVQRRSLNRGWKTHPGGKRYRKMESYCAANLNTFCFSRPIYYDETAKPTFIEFGVLKSDRELWVESFDNR
jgi:hypothetical protein